MANDLLNSLLIIDSKHLDKIPIGLYGLMITEDGLCFGPQIPENETRIGYFTAIRKNGSHIQITQDFLGTFGLYLYQNSDRYVISNSFFHLSEYLRGELTLNSEAARALIYSAYIPVGKEDTLANEIRKLDSQCSLEINAQSGKLSILQGTFPYFQKSLDNTEAFSDLDRWYERWTKIFHKLIEDGYPVNADLSGGFDTRIIFSLLKNAGADLDSIRILSHENINLAKDSDDYRIASEIADDHKFILNKNPDTEEKTGAIDPQTSVDKCRYLSFGSTVSEKYGLTGYTDPNIFIKGLFSSVKGNVWNNSLKTAVKSNLLPCRELCRKSGSSILKRISAVSDQREYIESQFNSYLTDPFPDERNVSLLHQKLIAERYDGKKALDWIANNHIIISPFSDPELVQFDYNRPDRGDNQFLVLLILDRYSPELLKYEIQGRKISQRSLDLARELNRKYPLKIKLPMDRIVHTPVSIRKKTISSAALGEHIQKICLSPDFTGELEKHLDKQLIRHILTDTNYSKLNSRSQPVNALLAIYEFLKLQK